jgi:tripartite-type tricarboxylate transporter receptor subunit TctC
MLQHDKAATLRLLAVAASRRTPQMPEVPTLVELGINLDFRIWIGLLAPAGTPEPILKQIESSTNEALRDPALRSAMVAQGWDIAGTSAA